MSLLFVFLTVIVPLKQAPSLSRAIQTIQSRNLKRTCEKKESQNLKSRDYIKVHQRLLMVSSRNIIAEKNLLLVLTHSEKRTIVYST